MLIIVPTPIGNLSDITARAVEALTNCQTIICEDSRRTGLLLHHLGISKPLIVLNDYNEPTALPQIIRLLHQDQIICLVSDAGTPLISDPGFKLVRAALQEGLPVDSLPGPSVVITALTLSGMPPDKFYFFGFLPEKPAKRLQQLRILQQISNLQPTTLIGFVSPYKLIRTFQEFTEVFGNIPVCLVHELSKIHQSVTTKNTSEWLQTFHQTPPKGEYTILWHPET